MTATGLLIFTAVYAAAVASPGPGIAAILARALGRGLSGVAPFIAGFVAGDITLFLVAATGLAVIVQTYGELIFAIKLAGAAYLLFLAWRLWQAPAIGPEGTSAATADESPLRLFLGSFSLTVGNPKAIVFFIAIVPTIVDLKSIDLVSILKIGLVIVFVMPCVLGSYALAADRARRLFTDSRSLRLLNRATAVVMAGAAAAVARA